MLFAGVCQQCCRLLSICDAGIFVNDFAEVLSSDTRENIVLIGKSLEDLTTAQVVVVTVDTLGAYDIDSYANELFRQWGIGQKEKNNGVLILNAVQERLLRIEVGYGLEGALTDIETAKIRKEYMNPHLQKGDYDSGLLSGYIAVVNEVAEEYGVSMDDIRQRLPSGGGRTMITTVSIRQAEDVMMTVPALRFILFCF